MSRTVHEITKAEQDQNQEQLDTIKTEVLFVDGLYEINIHRKFDK